MTFSLDSLSSASPDKTFPAVTVPPASIRRLRQSTLAAAVSALCALTAQAQPTEAAASAHEAHALPTVPVYGQGLGLSLDDMTTPIEVLEGEGLSLRRDGTLGAVLDGLPGVHASHFGAGASRPVIRGLDGPRVKVLNHGLEMHDASTISPDHAVVVDPLLAQQVEVLRGPSALLYGGAVGGVVHVLDDKIATERQERPWSGRVLGRHAVGATDHGGAFALTGQQGPLVLKLQGSARDAGDYRAGSGWDMGRKVPGSHREAQNGAIGLSWLGEQGYLGLAFTRQQSRYGLPGHTHEGEDCHPHGNHLHCGGHGGQAHDHHEEAHDHHEGEPGEVPQVDMRSNRWDLRGEWRQPVRGLAAVRWQASRTRYAHDEIAHGVTETRFSNRAHDWRLEAMHQPLAGWQGVWGVQSGQRRFAAEGLEGYVRPTTTHRWGMFGLEHYTRGDWRWQAAWRHDHQRITLQDGSDERRHAGHSASLGVSWRFQPGWQASLSYTHASRLPSAEELYARGMHLATRTYERGDATLQRETSRAWDLGLRGTVGEASWQVQWFHHRIHNYIYGRTLDALEGIQLLQYTQTDARLTGLEAQWTQRFNAQWSGTVFGDMVRARLAQGGYLPRTPAARLGLRVESRWQGGWRGHAEWVQVASQHRTAALESSTGGYGMLHLAVSRHWKDAQGRDWHFFVKGHNLTDRLAYAHTSFIKRDAPLAGRLLTVGWGVDF